MIVHAHLFISNDGGLRLTKTRTHPRPTELGLDLALDIPNSFFKRPVPVVNITIPDHLAELAPEIAAECVAPDVADALRIDVDAVTDGLVELVRGKNTNT